MATQTKFVYLSGETPVTAYTDADASGVLVYPADAAFDTTNIIECEIGSDVTSLPQYCFANSQLVTMVVPSPVARLGRVCFSGCTELTSVKLPDSLVQIGAAVFAYCSKLSSIRLPSSVNSIPTIAFKDCVSLKRMTVLAATPPTVYSDSFEGVTKDIPVYVPPASLSAYRADGGWGGFTNFLPVPTELTVIVSPSAQTYTGSALIPESVTVMFGAAVVPAESYDVAYARNTDVGTATVTVTGKGDYEGSSGSATFEITKAVNTVSDLAIDDWTYGGAPSAPTATAAFGGAIAFGYSSSADGPFESVPPTAAGTHYVQATSTATANYDSATAVQSFQITYGTYSITVEEGGSAPDYTASDLPQNVQMDALPTRTGHAVVGWTVSGATGGEPTATTDGDITIPARTFGDLTFAAQWSANTYALILDANGGHGGAAGDGRYAYSANAQTVPLTRPVRDGYAFAGWSASAGGTVSGDVLTIAAGAAADITVTAQWAQLYPVVLDRDDGIGGQARPSAYVQSSSAQTVELTPPRKGGYAFGGWSVTAGGGTVSGNVLTVAANATGAVTVKAIWELADYVIAVDPAGGIGGGASVSGYRMSNEELVVRLTEPTAADGRQFDGWTASRGFLRFADTLVLPAGTYGDVILRAKWVRRVANVTALARKGEHNDIGIRNGDFAFAEGKAAYAVILEAAVLTVQGELIYNVNEGIPYFDTAFLSPAYLKVWATNVQDRIKRFAFVEEIESFDYEFNAETGRVAYRAQVKTDEGTVEVSG